MIDNTNEGFRYRTSKITIGAVTFRCAKCHQNKLASGRKLLKSVGRRKLWQCKQCFESKNKGAINER